MLHICQNCGIYRPDKIVDPAGPFAICPDCQHSVGFKRLPLLIVGGASGTGKSTLCSRMAGKIQDAVLLDADILWRPEFNKPEDGYRDFFDLWLRIAVNIGQSGRPIVIFGAGFGVPENLEASIERRYFSTIRYLALVCEDGLLAERLHQRPGWRATGESSFIKEQQKFNRWFKDYTGEPPITLVDTTHRSPGETASEVEAWIQEGIS